MKSHRGIILGLVGCILVAGGAGLLASTQMDSLYTYRSPLHEAPPDPGEPLGTTLTRKVVLVLIDALRVDTSLDGEVMPTLVGLRAQGAWATIRSRPPSYSAPAWTTILTGAWPDINDGQALNPPTDDLVRAFTQDDIFSAVDRSMLNSAVSGYAWFEGMLVHSGVDAGFYTPGEDHSADLDVVQAALPWLSGEYALILVHLDQVDYAGHHVGGPVDPSWNAAARRVDLLLAEVITHLDLSLDTVIVLSDHGQIDRGGHGGHEAITLVQPFVMVGAGIIPGQYADIQQVDIAPTVAALLGTNIPASSQGRVLLEMLAIHPTDLGAIHYAATDQRARLLAAYQSSIGVQSAPKILDTPLSLEEALDAARASRLSVERTTQGVIASILALAPAGYMFVKRNRRVARLLAGAGFYLVSFNFAYAVLLGRPYSLSAINSVSDAIVTPGILAMVAFGLTWLLTSLRSGVFRTFPRQAAESSLGLTFIVIYVLLLPVLWSYCLNGIQATWTLPDFSSMFVGFLSIIQILFVSALGLLLTGASSLLAHFFHAK